jgi:hypothetical protein
MLASKKLVALAAALAVLAAPLPGAAAQTRTYHRHYAYRPAYRPLAAGYWNYPGYYGYGYGTGWRHRSNARGWDNTCLDLPWLPSEFACSAK